MKCPSCNRNKTIVTDSRAAADGSITRRRLKCQVCAYRFSTLEIAVEESLSGGKYQSDKEGYAWDSLISACLSRISVTTMLNEIKRRIGED